MEHVQAKYVRGTPAVQEALDITVTCFAANVCVYYFLLAP